MKINDQAVPDCHDKQSNNARLSSCVLAASMSAISMQAAMCWCTSNCLASLLNFSCTLACIFHVLSSCVIKNNRLSQSNFNGCTMQFHNFCPRLPPHQRVKRFSSCLVDMIVKRQPSSKCKVISFVGPAWYL